MKSMTMTRFLMCCCLGLTLTLTACIPGKEKEKQVLAQTDEARKLVKAEKAAADLANVALQLTSSMNVAEMDTSELRTIRCGVGDGSRVVAYVPRTATITRSGALTNDTAQRMRTDLEKRFTKAQVKTAADIAGCAALDPELVAINSPVLELTSDFAAQSNDIVDSSKVARVEMAKCPNNQPGVIIKKFAHIEDTVPTSTDSTKCGSSIDPKAPKIELGNTQALNWKAQLESTTGEPVFENFSCIATANGCHKIAERDFGTNVMCSQDADPEQYIVNPVYDKATEEFKATAEQNCGRPGWEGELVAKVTKKTCNVKRDCSASDPAQCATATTPAKVIDIAFVAAKCRNKEAETQDSCPTGFTFSDRGHVMKEEDLYMTGPLLLQPVKQADGTNVSSVSYAHTESGNEVTNMDDESKSMVGKTISMVTAASTKGRSGVFYSALTDLSSPPDDEFNQRFVDELRSLNKIRNQPGSPIECFTKGQTCYIGQEPAVVDVTVDRSAAMGAAVADVPVYQSNTYCDATMGNLFTDEQRVDACSAAKAYAEIAKNRDFKSYFDYYLDDTKDPLTQISALLPGAENTVPSTIRTAMDRYKAITIGALNNPVWKERLLYSMALGQSCETAQPNLPFFLKKFAFNTTRDLYGSCAAEFVSDTLVKTGVFNAGKTYPTCQSSCPGSCVTNITQRDTAQNPVPVKAVTRMQAIDLYIKNYLISRMPIKAKVTYAEFVDNKVDGVDSNAAGHQPIVLQDNQNLTAENIIAVDPGFYWKEAKEKISDKADARGSDPSGTVKLYRSIDAAIDRLLSPSGGGLLANKSKNASLIIFGSKYDNECLAWKQKWWEVAINIAIGNPLAFLSDSTMDLMTGGVFSLIDAIAMGSDCTRAYASKYFGRNICEPEPVPSKYRCDACIGFWEFGICTPRPEWDPDGGICAFGHCTGGPTTITRGHEDFTAADVQAKYNGIDDWENRRKYCESKTSWGRNLNHDLHIDVAAYERGGRGSTIKTPDNHNSLVGFIGRHFPNTKIYYFDADGKGIAEVCKGRIKGQFTEEQPNVFHNNKQVMHIFGAGDDMGKFMKSSIENATGGGEADDVAGELVCKAKFGDDANILYESPTNPPKRTQTFDSYGDANMSCKGPVNVVGVKFPADMPSLGAPVTWTPPPVIDPNEDPNGCDWHGYNYYGQCATSPTQCQYDVITSQNGMTWMCSPYNNGGGFQCQYQGQYNPNTGGYCDGPSYTNN